MRTTKNNITPSSSIRSGRLTQISLKIFISARRSLFAVFSLFFNFTARFLKIVVSNFEPIEPNHTNDREREIYPVHYLHLSTYTQKKGELPLLLRAQFSCRCLINKKAQTLYTLSLSIAQVFGCHYHHHLQKSPSPPQQAHTYTHIRLRKKTV